MNWFETILVFSQYIALNFIIINFAETELPILVQLVRDTVFSLVDD